MFWGTGYTRSVPECRCKFVFKTKYKVISARRRNVSSVSKGQYQVVPWDTSRKLLPKSLTTYHSWSSNLIRRHIISEAKVWTHGTVTGRYDTKLHSLDDFQHGPHYQIYRLVVSLRIWNMRRAGVAQSAQWLGYGLKEQRSIPCWGRDSSLCHCHQTGPGSHLVTYPKGIEGSFPGGKWSRRAKLMTYLHLVPRLIMRGSIPPLPSKWLITHRGRINNSLKLIVPYVYWNEALRCICHSFFVIWKMAEVGDSQVCLRSLGLVNSFNNLVPP
jgi:hypothetical protein